MTYIETVIAGCGNPLFGDDGFGPAVAEELQKFPFPDYVMAIDAGTSAPELVFPLLDPTVTKKIIIIDVVDFGAAPGTVVLLRPEDFPLKGIHDAQVGGIIGSLGTIRTGIEIVIVGCQPGIVTYPEMAIGLSGEVNDAIPRTVQIIRDLIRKENALLKDTFLENYGRSPENKNISTPDNPLYCTILKPAATPAGTM